jgi:hypothetical protein
MAGDKRWRRPWRRVSVPGEGSANMDKGGAHEHRGSVRMRFPYPMWSETGRKVVVDGEVDFGLLRRVAARGRVDSGQGKLEAQPERVGRLAGRERKLLGAGIWAGREPARRRGRWEGQPGNTPNERERRWGSRTLGEQPARAAAVGRREQRRKGAEGGR